MAVASWFGFHSFCPGVLPPQVCRRQPSAGRRGGEGQSRRPCVGSNHRPSTPSRTPNTHADAHSLCTPQPERRGPAAHPAPSWPKDQLFRLCAKTHSALGYSPSSLPETGNSRLLTEVCSVGTHQGWVHKGPRTELPGRVHGTHIPGLWKYVRKCGHDKPGGDDLAPAGLTTVLQLHLGHCCSVHLIRAISKAQSSGPSEELSQWVVAAQPCCSEGLADTQQERRKPWVSLHPWDPQEQVPAPKMSGQLRTATFQGFPLTPVWQQCSGRLQMGPH